MVVFVVRLGRDPVLHMVPELGVGLVAQDHPHSDRTDQDDANCG